MEIIRVERLSFHYPDQERAAVADVSFSVAEGEFVVLCGASGCGKTTLLRQLKREVAPVGERKGSIWWKGVPLAELPPREAAEQIGMVFQNPENQIVTDTVWHELAFSMENLGYPLAVMRKRLAELAHDFGLEQMLYKSVHELSGGQKQWLNLASVLLLQPKLLLLDEPTSQLDPVASREFIQLLRRVNQEFGMTIIISEHRLEELLPLADRVILLADGSIKYDGAPRAIGERIGRESPADRSYLPAVTRLYMALQAQVEAGQVDALPLTVREGKRWLSSVWRAEGEEIVQPVQEREQPRQEIVKCLEVTYQYGKGQPHVLRSLSMHVYRNEFLAIVGGNGAGKTTLLQVMAGLSAPQRGKVIVEPSLKIGYLAQNPLLYFSCDTVREELEQMAKHASLPEPKVEIERLLRVFELEELLCKNPYDLSGGQQQKVALAMVLLSKPDVLLIDEPTKGLDPSAKMRLAELLQELRAAGTTIVMVTHDVEFAARHVTRCAMLFDGSILAEGDSHSFFSENYYYTTAINRTVREWVPDALTEEDVMRRWVASSRFF